MVKTLIVYVAFVLIVYTTANVAVYGESGHLPSWNDIRPFCIGLWLLAAFATPGVYITHFRNKGLK